MLFLYYFYIVYFDTFSNKDLNTFAYIITTNNKQQTTNNKQQTTNNKQQTTNNKQQTKC